MSLLRVVGFLVCTLPLLLAAEANSQAGPQPVKPEDKTKIVPIVRPLFSGEKILEPRKREKIEPIAGLSMEVRGERIPEDQVPAMDTFVGDLSIRYGIDSPKFMVTLNPTILRAQGWERGDLLKTSVQNLTRIYQGTFQVQRPKPGFGMLTGGGELESSWLLVKDFWEQEAKSAKGALVAAVPARDVLVFVDAGVPDRVEELRRLVTKVYEQAGRSAVSRLLYVWKAGAWEMYE
jgi:uncharacterized protein YtpQ (UPF0354 family)